MSLGNECVHTRHCCVVHGCKYGDKGCPVYLGYKKQDSPCYTCKFGIDELESGSEHKYNFQYEIINFPEISQKEIKRRRKEFNLELGDY